MSVNNFPTFERKDIPPPGLLPKNTQTLVLGGIAVVMVLVIAFSGRKSPPEHKAPPLPTPTADTNLRQIQEYKARIEEQAARLRSEQERVTQTRQAMGLTPMGLTVDWASANGPAAGEIRPTLPAYGYSSYSRSAIRGTQYAPSGSGGYAIHEKSALQVEREKRDYESLFASNVALSRRSETKAQTALATGTNEPTASKAEVEATDGALHRNVSPDAGDPTQLTQEKQTSVTLATKQKGAALAHRSVNEHGLFEGTVIETVLTNRLDGSFSGPVNCMVTTNVYSRDGQHLLIPQGSRVLGEIKRIETFGQQRLAVTFHRLIMPDGYSITLDQLHGLNQIGETGLRDKVNNHFLQVFGVSIAIGAIAGLAQANTQYGATATAEDAYRQGVASSVSQSSLRILDRYLNVLPTFTIREGHRVKVYLSGDLFLPSYEKHPHAKEEL